MKTFPSITSVLAACALSALPVNAADVLVNGNFNTGDTNGWWTYLADTNSSITVVTNNPGFSFDGSPFAYEMVRNTSPDPLLGQDVSLGAGAQYWVSLQYRGTNWGGAGVSINYLDSSWTYLSYEWAPLYSGNGSDTGWQSFTTPTWTTPANTAYVELRLDAWGWSDTYYDNVVLNVVPEPGCGALLALGGLLLIRRWNARARR